MRRKKIKIPFEHCASAVPVIKIKIKNRIVFVLVDTGAETTLFNKDFIKAIDADYTVIGDSTTFVGMSGEGNKTPVVTTSIECKIEKDKFVLNGMLANLNPVSDHFAKIYGDKYRPDILLGGDNLDKFDAKVDFEKKEIVFLQ